MKFLLSISLIIFLFGCSGKPAKLTDFNYEEFKSDKKGCLGKRKNYINSLEKQSDKLLGLSQSDINQTFGKYDVQVLSRRNKKVYIYFLEPGPHCDQLQNKSEALDLALEINSVGLVEEVIFQKGLPY